MFYFHDYGRKGKKQTNGGVANFLALDWGIDPPVGLLIPSHRYRCSNAKGFQSFLQNTAALCPGVTTTMNLQRGNSRERKTLGTVPYPHFHVDSG